MHIFISTIGTRGDVQPYLALAVALRAAGHEPVLATSDNYSDWIRSYGVGVRPVTFNMQAWLQEPEVRAVVDSGNPVRGFALLREAMHRAADALDNVWAGIQESDYVVESGTGAGALEATELLGIPGALAYPLPFAPTRAFPSFFAGVAHRPLGGVVNLLTHHLMHRVLWAGMTGPMTGRWRRRLGLRPWRSYSQRLAFARRQGLPILYGFSPSIVPRPPDWDENQHVTGAWFLPPPPDWTPPPALTAFLEAGPPPVYIGFGSMGEENPKRLSTLALDALAQSGQRGVIATGWGGLSALSTPESVYVVDDIPHEWLFPRMAAVVHHGGAGTTAAGLRAGVPGILVPFARLGDQHAWAARVAALGVGPRVASARRLSAAGLGAAIRTAVTDPAMRARAARLGEAIRAEPGTARAVALIESHAK